MAIPIEKHTAFAGGLDLYTPAIAKKAGAVIGCINYDAGPNGYRRIDGYERLDGRAKPSEASYWILYFDAGTAAISEGDTVDGATSSASGVALIDAVITSGSYVGTDAVGFLVLTAVSGTFQDNEDLEVSAVKKSESSSVATEEALPAGYTDDDAATWSQDAIETARTAIGVCPGSGDILGVWQYSGVNYAVRNNAGGTAAVIHKSSTSGWTAIDMGETLAFDAGVTEFVVGETLTGAGGTTATIAHVLLTDGAWDGSGVGIITVYGVTSGPYVNNEALTSASGAATADGVNAAQTLSPDGRFEFVNYNFTGHSGNLKMYGCDGVNTAFQWDGTYFIQVITGMTTDTPDHIIAHRNHLFLSFDNGSLQHSSIGDPVAPWSVITGAAELGLGVDITGFAITQSVLVIFGANRTSILYGTSTADWDLRQWANETGAIEWSIQEMFAPVFMDQGGIRDMKATQAYGDFLAGTLSRVINPIVQAKFSEGRTVTASFRVRGKDMYRVFFDDGTGISLSLTDNTPMFTTIEYDRTVLCTASVEDNQGTETVLFGSTDGYVYQTEKGTSFDGREVTAVLRPSFTHLGSPTRRKRYIKLTLELDVTNATAVILVTPEYEYGDLEFPVNDERIFTLYGGGGFWDSDIWQEFQWDNRIEETAHVWIDGIGTNIGFVLVSKATYETPHTLHGFIVQYSILGF
jgi:hypothetical protein